MDKRLVSQILRFAVVGTLAFLIDFGFLIFFTEVFHISYLASATLSFIIALIFNYVVSMRFVFAHKEGMSKQREFIIFVVLSVIGLTLNDVLMWSCVDLFAIDYRFAKIVATVLVTAYNFISRKVFLDGNPDLI